MRRSSKLRLISLLDRLTLLVHCKRTSGTKTTVCAKGFYGASFSTPFESTHAKL